MDEQSFDGQQSFEIYLVRGAIESYSNVPDNVPAFRSMQQEYDRAYQIAKRLILVGNLNGREEDANKSFLPYMEAVGYEISNTRLREWYRVYAQAWYDTSSAYTPRIPSAPNRIIMPVETTISWHEDDNAVIICYTGRRLGGYWRGVEHPIWQSFATVPGNLAALEVITDIHGKRTLDLSILVYHAIAQTTHEFSLWLKGGVENTPHGKGKNIWVTL